MSHRLQKFILSIRYIDDQFGSSFQISGISVQRLPGQLPTRVINDLITTPLLDLLSLFGCDNWILLLVLFLLGLWLHVVMTWISFSVCFDMLA